ncbi:MAG: phospholipid carrier-dependent glycosyltransferase [Dehalococcoidia bacterium]|nr:phospholipid carrier-dependent glycosyltransferase [Dehalococcoidia bacterium]
METTPVSTPVPVPTPETIPAPPPKWFKKWENLAAIGLALLVMGLHFIVINNPHDMVLDEQHYVPEANRILDGEDLQRLEHPPLGKLLIAAGIEIFGDNALGWRFFPVMFGTASIILFYLVCQKLTRRRYVPLLATFLFAFENSSFVQSGVAMLDVFIVTFMLAAFLLYLRGWYISSGVALALSALVKFSAASAGIAIFLHWIFTRRKPKQDGIKFLIAAPVAYMALMPLGDYLATGDLLYPWDRIHYMVTTMSTLTFSNVTAGNASYPWEWVWSPEGMAFWYTPSYMSGINWTLWALIIPSMAFAIYGAVKRNSLLLFASLWFAATYLVWFPVWLITDRIMFRFYFYPTVGAVCLALGFALSQIMSLAARQTSQRVIWIITGAVATWLIANLVIFVFMSPLL